MNALIPGLVMAAVLVSTGAHALSINSISDPGGTISYDFEGTVGPNLLTTVVPGVGSLSGGSFAFGDTPDVAVQPLGASGNYWTVDPTSSPGVFEFTTPLSALSFLWGSPDSFNDLGVELNDSGSFTPLSSIGSSGLNSDSSYVSLVTSGSEVITALSFTSIAGTGYAFEVDNLRISPVPEPETYTILLAGLAAISFMARRRRVAS